MGAGATLIRPSFDKKAGPNAGFFLTELSRHDQTFPPLMGRFVRRFADIHVLHFPVRVKINEQDARFCGIDPHFGRRFASFQRRFAQDFGDVIRFQHRRTRRPNDGFGPFDDRQLFGNACHASRQQQPNGGEKKSHCLSVPSLYSRHAKATAINGDNILTTGTSVSAAINAPARVQRALSFSYPARAFS